LGVIQLIELHVKKEWGMVAAKNKLAHLIIGMKAAYERGENAMAWARNNLDSSNCVMSTLIAYDLQAGTYVEDARRNSMFRKKWCEQLAELITPHISTGDRILEVGVGEATTLVGVINAIKIADISAYGFDLSWSRINVANNWVAENNLAATLFVGDLFNIPLEDNSVDLVYTSHSLEPNGGEEEKAIKELLRIARKAVVLVEPYYELATKKAQDRMLEHGYVRGLKETAERLGVIISDARLLNVFDNPLNPSGVITLMKPVSPDKRDTLIRWQDPLTGLPLNNRGDYFIADEVGIAYPVLKGIPCLRSEHAIVCSKLSYEKQ
jgi:SAM-dependent methyltransferase